MQLARPFSPHQLNRPHANAQMLVYPFAVKVVHHAGPFDFAVQRLVAHAQQCAVGTPKNLAGMVKSRVVSYDTLFNREPDPLHAACSSSRKTRRKSATVTGFGCLVKTLHRKASLISVW